ncbi:hypothetical protein SI65_01151 [Aspergillus cristatus]|uniref:Thioredoxin domain-containing protein n=1 Tax=Aspergillus cristatus TaxID=573508 RepID=A0A1E3BRG1_ASPCR|nr:hypothetical protein SI65_01151 [Aspergillus cristatus]
MTSKHQPTTTSDPDDLDDDEALFATLENEDDSAYRANRIEQLNAEYASAKNGPALDPSSFASNPANPAAGNGAGTIITDTFYPTLTSDQSVLGFTTNTHRCVVHFAHPDFTRCGVMDEHMRTLATRHYEVKFARVDVRHTPFIVEKLKIKVLPCVIGFKDGLGVERVLGFEGLGSGGRDGKDGFSIAILEKRLLWKGILVQAKIKQGDRDDDDDDYESAGSDEDTERPRRAIRSGGRLNRNDDNDDDDWD